MKNVKEAKVKQEWTRVIQYLAYFTQSCLTLCGPMVYTVHGLLQARILEWVAYLFSSRSSQLRNWTGVSCIAGRFFTNWAIREALLTCSLRVIIHFRSFSFNSYWYIKWNGNISWNIDRCPALLTRSRLLNLFGSIFFFLWCLKIIF